MVVETVKELDLEKYLGRWHEMYSSLIQRQTFQRNLCCTTATYTLRDDKSISVLNAGCKTNSAGEVGELKSANGVAVFDPEKPGQLTVGFRTPPKDNNNPNYNVIKLGPKTHGEENLYEYSVISTPSKALMWVLARDPKTFKEKYDKEVREFLDANGFNWFWNRPRETYQGDNCKYPPMPNEETNTPNDST